MNMIRLKATIAPYIPRNVIVYISFTIKAIQVYAVKNVIQPCFLGLIFQRPIPGTPRHMWQEYSSITYWNIAMSSQNIINEIISRNTSILSN